MAAGRDLDPGEELTDMYTVHWTSFPVQERQEYLARVFHFPCSCKPCREGWQPPEEEVEDQSVVERLALHTAREEVEAGLVWRLEILTKSLNTSS